MSQVWHFLTRGRTWWHVGYRFARQAPYFCNVFRTYIAFYVVGSRFWTFPASFLGAIAVLQTCPASRLSENGICTAMRSSDKVQIAWQACEESKLEEVSHEILVFRFPYVLCCVSGFPLALSIGEPRELLYFEAVEVSKLEKVSHEMLVFRFPHV